MHYGSRHSHFVPQASLFGSLVPCLPNFHNIETFLLTYIKWLLIENVRKCGKTFLSHPFAAEKLRSEDNVTFHDSHARFSPSRTVSTQASSPSWLRPASIGGRFRGRRKGLSTTDLLRLPADLDHRGHQRQHRGDEKRESGYRWRHSRHQLWTSAAALLIASMWVQHDADVAGVR